MGLQILLYIILFLFFNGLFFVSFRSDKDKVKQNLFELIRGCTRVERGTFFSEGIPQDTHKAKQWANEKLEDKSWIFWNAVLHILDDNEIVISIINSFIFTICFILPKYL